MNRTNMDEQDPQDSGLTIIVPDGSLGVAIPQNLEE
jgi:hypothetical protein